MISREALQHPFELGIWPEGEVLEEEADLGYLDISVESGWEAYGCRSRGVVCFVSMRRIVQSHWDFPIGHWPKDRKLKEIGRVQRVQMIEAIPTFTVVFLHLRAGLPDGKDAAADRGDQAGIHGSPPASVFEVALCLRTETSLKENPRLTPTTSFQRWES